MTNRPISTAFRDPDRARINWDFVEHTASRAVLSALVSLLRGSPDPDSALNYFERFHSNAPARIIQYLEKNPAALNVLIPLFSQSQFLSETLVLHPDWLEWLHRDKRLEFIKAKEDLLEELSRFEATLGNKELPERLALFKRREYLRIVLRDVARISTLAETTLELSTLADVILEKAWRWSDQVLSNRHGPPRALDEAGRIIPSDFVVLALGKMGGNELNYSSDIDLMYLYSHEGETAGIDSLGESKISNQEYFIKLSSALTEAVSGVTPSGWAFRVDLRLRPQGREGFLTRSVPSAVEYYQQHAAPWELQALLKARPVAGKISVGKEFLRRLQPRIYPAQDKARVVEGMRQMRSMLDAKLGSAEAAGFNVKLARGGIRDIEFIAQCLQRIHGAGDLWVREGNTVLALRRLQDNNYLWRQDFVALASAYEFFRIVEHRLQLERGLQTHTVPDSPEEQQLLALRLGFEDVRDTTAREALVHAIEYHRGAVLQIYERIVSEKSKDPGPLTPTWPESEQPCAPKNEPQDLPRAPLATAFALVDTRFALASEIPFFTASAEAGLLSFLESIRLHRHWLTDRRVGKDSLARIGGFFNSGVVMIELALRHPEWVIPVLFPALEAVRRREKKRGPRDRAVSKKIMLPVKRGRHVTEATRIVEMRTANQRRLVDTLTHDLLAAPHLRKTLSELSRSAEATIGEALSVAKEVVRKKLSAAERTVLQSPLFRFGVFGLGRMATRELDVGSDLDLVFVSDYSYFRSRDVARRAALELAECVISLLSSYTREGRLYAVDLRLRPSGAEGELVQDSTHWIDYFRGAAHAWEHVAYLKLRALAGDLQWAQQRRKKLRSVSLRVVHNREICADLWDIRARLDQAAGAAEQALNLKQGPGGMFDVDFALGYRLLREGRSYPCGLPLAQALRRAARENILDSETAEVFSSAVEFYRLLDHSLRLLKGQAVKTIDRKLLEELPRTSVERLLAHAPSYALRDRPARDLMAACNLTAEKVRGRMREVLKTSA